MNNCCTKGDGCPFSHDTKNNPDMVWMDGWNLRDRQTDRQMFGWREWSIKRYLKDSFVSRHVGII